MSDVIADNDPVKRWERRIEQEEKIRHSYRNRCVNIEKIYSANSAPFTANESGNSPDIDYNILWINSQILQAAMFSQNPQPDVRRRYKDALDVDPAMLQAVQMLQSENPQEQQMAMQAQQAIQQEEQRVERYNKIGKDVSILLERALTFTQDQEDSFGNGSAAVLDFVKMGAGQQRVRYVPVVTEGMPKKITVIKGEDGGYARQDTGEVIDNEMLMDIQPDGDGFFMEEMTEETLAHEELQPEYVPLSRFHWECVSNWKDVSWCVIDHFLTKDEMIDQFGKAKADEIPLEYTDDGTKVKEGAKESAPNRALIRECFDKRKLKVQIYAEGGAKLLEDMDDPYNLQDFYPFPKPMFGTMGDDGINPIPDYVYYQDQHAELNTITSRINKLLEVIKYRGFYDGSLDGLSDVEAMNDGEFKPLGNFAELAAMNGGNLDLNKLIAEMPMAEAKALLDAMYNYREQVVNVIYEITGISDIVRGSTKASETLGAQQLKSQYASLRLSTRQKEVERFFRDTMRIQAEFLSETFEPETLEGMTGMEVTDEMIEVLSSDLLRAYVVDVETDSTVLADSATEQKERTEALTALTGMFQQLAPMTQMGLPVELVGQMLLFGLKGFKGARELEDMIQTMMDGQAAQQQQQQEQPQEPPVDPEQEARAGLIGEETRALKIDNDATESGIMGLLEEMGGKV